jgi:sugar phosphate isomerase/epimerase
LARLSILAEILGKDLEKVAHELPEIGLSLLDLKRHVFGHAIEEMDDTARDKLAVLMDQSDIEIFSFSSTCGYQNVSTTSERDFRDHLTRGVDNMLETLSIVRPRMVRLLACSFDDREAWDESNAYLEQHAPWVYDAYDDAIERIAEAGVAVTIENEPNTILSNPQETVGFFDRLRTRDRVGFTWDIQNMWQSGSYPTVEAYQVLRPVINYVHTKGGQGAHEDPELLTFRSPLETATWPVREILGEILEHDSNSVICINTSHGKVPAGAPPLERADRGRMEALRDIAFLRDTFGEIE